MISLILPKFVPYLFRGLFKSHLCGRPQLPAVGVRSSMFHYQRSPQELYLQALTSIPQQSLIQLRIQGAVLLTSEMVNNNKHSQLMCARYWIWTFPLIAFLCTEIGLERWSYLCWPNLCLSQIVHLTRSYNILKTRNGLRIYVDTFPKPFVEFLWYK